MHGRAQLTRRRLRRERTCRSYAVFVSAKGGLKEGVQTKRGGPWFCFQAVCVLRFLFRMSNSEVHRDRTNKPL